MLHLVVQLKFTIDPEVRSVSYISLVALKTEAARTSKMLVNFYQTTRCNMPEDSRHLGLMTWATFIWHWVVIEPGVAQSV
jgi:hypothetical protein